MIARRGFIAGLAGLLAAPAIIRTPGLLMPVKVLRRLGPYRVADYMTASSARSANLPHLTEESLRQMIAMMRTTDSYRLLPHTAIISVAEYRHRYGIAA